MNMRLLECVPNFSEGRNLQIIEAIAHAIRQTEGVQLLDVDPGKATNRTVYTFVGEPEAVVEAAFQAIKTATELIDMRSHKGEHPRFGATDVCPLIPVSGISMEEAAEYARKLAQRVGHELQYPVFLYESAASAPHRKNLAHVRAGEYEGLQEKLTQAEWQPDYGPARFVAKTGATAIGARDFLIAVNFNLNSTSVRRANAVAFDVREAGRVVKETDPKTGEISETRIPGTLKAAKAIGWFIEEYGIAQVSMNLTNIQTTPLHLAFDAVNKSATERGLRVSGTEIVGMVPLRVLTEAGKHYLRKQNRSVGVAESELIKIAIKSLGLDDLVPFDPKQKILEYKLSTDSAGKLVNLNLSAFSEQVASESPAPGGGSVAAYIAACGAALATMVANLSAHKRGWDDRITFFSDWAEKGEKLRKALTFSVDADTDSFNKLMEAFALPKSNDTEKQLRKKAIEEAQSGAIQVPLSVMKLAFEGFSLAESMISNGNPNSVSDAAVGSAALYCGLYGAYLNVCINLKDYPESDLKLSLKKEADQLLKSATLANEKNQQLAMQIIDS